MLIVGNSHVSLFEDGIRCGSEPARIRWTGALRVNHFFEGHPAGAAIRSELATEKGWVFLTIGHHDVLDIWRAGSAGWDRHLEKVLAEFSRLFEELSRRGRVAVVRLGRQNSFLEESDRAAPEQRVIDDRLWKALAPEAKKKGIVLLDPLADLRDAQGQVPDGALRADGIHVRSALAGTVLKEFSRIAGIEIAPSPDGGARRPKDDTEPGHLASLLAVHLDLPAKSGCEPSQALEAILELARSLASRHGSKTEITPTTDLVSSGLLDSLDLAELWSGLHERFGQNLQLDLDLRALATAREMTERFVHNADGPSREDLAILAEDAEITDHACIVEASAERFARAGRRILEPLRKAQSEILGSSHPYGLVHLLHVLCESDVLEASRILEATVARPLKFSLSPGQIAIARKVIVRRLLPKEDLRGSPQAARVWADRKHLLRKLARTSLRLEIGPILEAWSAVLRTDFDLELARLRLAVQSNDRDNAWTLVERLQEIWPWSAEAQLLRANLHLSGGDIPSATKSLDEARRLDPALEGLEDMKKSIDSASESSVMASVQKLVVEAESHFAQGRSDAALQKLLEAEALDPNSRQLVDAVAWMQVQMGNLSAAQAQSLKATLLWPNDPSTHANLAGIYLQRGLPERADAPLRTALRLDPRHCDANLALARILDQRGETGEAILLWNRFLENAPADHPARIEASRRTTPRTENGLLWSPGRKVGKEEDILEELAGRPITARIANILVVGAHKYQEAQLLDKLFPGLKHITLFEPIPPLKQELEVRFRHDARIHVSDFAISDEDGSATFHVTNNLASSSLLPLGKHLEIFPHVQEIGPIPVRTRKLGSAMRELDLPDPDMLFIDVQGAEYKVLSGIDASILAKVSIIYTEASTEPLYQGSRVLEDLKALLGDRFEFLGFAPLTNNTPTHGNAMFVRRDLLAEVFPQANQGVAGDADEAAGRLAATLGELRQDPSNESLLAQAKQDLAIARGDRTVGIARDGRDEPDRRQDVKSLVEMLDASLAKGLLAQAAQFADTIVNLCPNDVDHIRTSGHIHLKLGNLEMARNRFEHSTVVAPESAAAHADLGVVWFLLERWTQAKHHFETAYGLDPSRHDIPGILRTIAQKNGVPNWPACDVDARRFHIPPTGSTERFIRMTPVRRSSATTSGSNIIRNLSIRDLGSGNDALSGIVQHILKHKLDIPDPVRAISSASCIAFGVEIDLVRARDGAPITSAWRDLTEFDPEFARLEGPERSKDIQSYKERILAGEQPPAATFVTGAFLNSCGAKVAPDELWMIDGARRISAQALAGRGTVQAIVLTTETHHATLIPQERVQRLKEKIAKIEWFANYQSIPLVGLQGDRSTRRFEWIDPALLEGASVADWGCNIGQASVKAALAGASSVLGIEGMPDTFEAAQEVGMLSGLSNLRFARVDFNAPDFDDLVDAVLPQPVDWSFFFSVYRTKELVQRDRLFQKIIDKSRKGIFFEGHADAVIDTIDYYKWLFEAYGLEWRHLGNSEGSLRPLFLLTWDPARQRRQNPSWKSASTPVRAAEPVSVPQPVQVGAAPLVSAIVSTYASSSLLRHRLENLLSQTLGDRLEIVVIDSGSPENDGEIAEEFARRDSRVRVIRTKERETIYQAWNRGVEAARGRFLTNANTDDVLRKDALERLASELESDPGIDLAYGDFWITHLPNQEFDGAIRIGYSLKPDWRADIMLTGCHMGPQPMWRRSLHERFGLFDASIFAAGDYEFWCRCAAGGAKFRHVPEFLGLYLHNLKGICNGDVPRVVRETAAIKEKYRTLLPPPPPDFKAEGFYRKEPLPQDAGFVNIGMVTWNRLEFSREAMEALWRKTRYPYKLTVVDNGSTDGTVEWLREMHKQGKISNLFLLGENVGVAKASNTAWAAEPTASHYMKLDSDMVALKDDWLENLVETALKIGNIGALGYSVEPKSYPLESFGSARVRPKRDANIGGACYLIPKSVHERLGWWCEDYGLYGEEDGDFSLRIRLAGLFNAYMEDEDAFCHLPGGKAGAIDPRDLSAIDPDELRVHEDYRIWKDDLRRELQKPGGLLPRNVVAYQSGQRSLYVPRGKFQGLLGPDLQAFLRSDEWEFHPLDGKVSAEHQARVREFAASQSAVTPSIEDDGHPGWHYLALRKAQEKREIRASIVIPVHGHLDLTRQCVEHLQATTDPRTTEIVVVDDASPDATADWMRQQQTSGSIKTVFLSPNRGFAGACNAGAEVCQGQFIVFLNNDTIVRPGWLEALIAPLTEDPGIGLTGARLLYPEGDIQHAGIRLHPNGLPDHEFRHAAADDPRVGTSRDRAFVTGACIALRKELFTKIGCFDTGFRMYVEDLDLCLKVWNESLRVRYVAECVVVHLESRTTPDLEKRTALVKTGMERLFSRWMGRWPQGLFRLEDWPANFRNTVPQPPPSIPSDAPRLHAFAPTFNFTGYARLDREAFLAAETTGMVQLSLDPSVNSADFIKDLESQGEAATAPWNRILSRKPDHDSFCLISDLPCNFAKLRAARPAFARYAGLTMFETDRLPSGWKDDCLGVDEIWVPSTFNLRSFAAAGVPERMLKQIPCGIDMERYRPGACAPLGLQGRRGTNFLSVFEWTPRKGWDTLLLGWAKAFRHDDDASLTIKAYIANTQPGELAERIDSFFRSRDIDPASLAPIIVVDGFLPEAAMPGLYAAADVFALPTRGEGWGLPYLEAMASGIPVIATGWSAHLDFVTSDNGYLIDHRLVPVSKEQTQQSGYYGQDHIWAEPSVEHFAELLRRCHRHRDEVRTKGLKARISVQDAWSARRTAQWISERICVIESKSTALASSSHSASPIHATRQRIGFDARTLSVADSIVRGIGNYAWHHLLAILETRPGCDLTILHDDTVQPPSEFVKRTTALGAKWAAWSSRTAADFDIFHTPDPMHVYPGYASPFQRFGSTRVTATFHDIIPIRVYEGRIANWPGYLARLDELSACGATLLCNSEFTRQDILSATSLDPRKAIAVMAGFNASATRRKWSRGEGDAFLRRLGIDKPFFLHVGAADPHKNFESSLAACQAIGKSRAVQLVVAGKLANALGAMREQVVQAGLKDVVFTDYLEREELELLYSRAVATLFLSRYEGFGFPALEAMASGCPVIASNAASIPEIVGDAALLHAPDDLPGIAASMVRLLDNTTLRDDLIRRGTLRAGLFDWKDVARRTWAAWDKLLEEREPETTPPPPPAKTQWISPVWDPSGYADESRAFLRHLATSDLGVGLLAWGRHSESFRQSVPVTERKTLDSLMGRELVAGRPVVLDIPAGSLGRVSDGGIHVGRTTFETDGLPAEWVVRCNSMDELWVPCRFNKETFSKAGVTKPILIVPEGVDTNRFRPGLDPLPLPVSRKGTTYLSIFEWTHRKGPDLLLEAWAKSFSASDDVELVLRCYPPNQIEGDPIEWIEQKIDEEFARIGTTRSRCAPIVVLAKQVPDADMPRLYAVADVYLAPSRGEGWGRPHMEAMSCGLPVIATRWSGNLEFQNDDNSWLIDIDGLEEIDAREEFSFYRGQKWATPSLSHLVALLRASATDVSARRKLGETARRDMVERWDWSIIAPLAETRLREILQGVGASQSALNAQRSRTTPFPNDAGASRASAIRWCGQMFNFSGYARLSRETVAALMDAMIPVTADPLLPDQAWFMGLGPEDRERWKSLLKTPPAPGVLVCCDLPCDAGGRNELFQQMHEANPDCDVRVGWTMFESDRLPEGWAKSLNRLDEIWVPSNFNRATFAQSGVDASKLHVVPGGIDTSRYGHATPLSIQGPRRSTTFLSVFQWTRRKGWDILLRAWAQAFKPQADVRLVLRCHPFGNDSRSMRDVFNDALRALGLTESDMAPIILLDAFVPESDLPALYAACDVFVLPSRGEGWGFPFLEAMASGKPCIATAWGASVDFLDVDCAWLASPGDLVEVSPDDIRENRYLAPGHRWANPDPSEIAGFLRQAASDVPMRLRKSQNALRTASRWSHHRTARAIIERITALSRQNTSSSSILTDALRATAAGIVQRHHPAYPAASPKAIRQAGLHPTEALRQTAEGIRSRHGIRPSSTVSQAAETSPTIESLSIRWEGSQFVHHSLANVNREICLRLAKAGHDLSLIPYEPDQFQPGEDPDLGILARLREAPLEGPCQVHVRHQWPPRLDAPAQGHWVVVQPWEFGSPPKDWIPAFRDRVDEIWCYSEYVKRVYLDAGVPEAKLAVVPLGVDVNKYRPGLATLPDLVGDPSRTTFLFVGGTIARKGFDCLLNAWAKAFGPKDPVRLVVKGMGGGTFYKGQTGEAMVRELNASGKAAPVILFERDLSPDEVPHIYACADVLVHPYRGEGFGLPIAEAMASGLPCIVTRGGAADDFCGSEEAWLVDAVHTPVPGGKVGPFETVAAPWWLEPDIDSLVHALRAAFAKPDMRKTKGLAARKRIEAAFTWDHAAAKMEARLAFLASRPTTSSPVASTKFVSSLDKLSIRITTPGGLDPVPPSIPGSRVDSDEIALLDRLLIRAEAAAARKDFAEAEDLTRQAVEQHPRQNMAWLARAMILRGSGKFRKATDAIEQSLKLEETPDALLESIQIHLAANEPGAARKVEKALKDRHGVWLKACRELFRAKGQTWPLDLLKPPKAATGKGKR